MHTEIKWRSLMYIRHLLNANNIFTFSESSPLIGMPEFANQVAIKALSVNTETAQGCGIYFILYKRKLVYLGKFLGTKSDAFSGDIFSARWNRHISTLSLRGKAISIGSSLVARFKSELGSHPLAAELTIANSKTLAHDRGFMVPFNRLKFAALKWSSFSLTPDNWLPDIDFGYIQLDRNHWSGYSTNEIRTIISNAETKLIDIYKPICNGGSPFDERLIFDIPHNDLFDSIESALSDKTISVPKELMSVIEQLPSVSLPDEIESPRYAEQLSESLPSGCPEETISAVNNTFGLDANVQIHSTKTNGGDIRVRVLNISRPRNVFTMYWQVKKEIYHCRILLTPNEVTGPGIVNATDSYANEPLPTTFGFDCSSGEGAIPNLIKLINKAISNAQ